MLMIEVFLIILCLLCLDGNFRYIRHFKLVYFIVCWFTQVVILNFWVYMINRFKNAKFPMVSLKWALLASFFSKTARLCAENFFLRNLFIFLMLNKKK